MHINRYISIEYIYQTTTSYLFYDPNKTSLFFGPNSFQTLWRNSITLCTVKYLLCLDSD